MSRTTQQPFTEATLLYARNKPLVDKLSRGMEEEIVDHVHRLESHVRAALGAAKLRTSRSKSFDETDGRARYRYWWDGRRKNLKAGLYLWVDTFDAEMVVDGVLRLWVSAPAVADDVRRRIRALASQERFKGYCTLGHDSRWRFLMFEVPLADPEAMEQHAQVLAEFLRQVWKIEASERATATEP